MFLWLLASTGCAAPVSSGPTEAPLCVPREGTTGTPSTIAEVLDLVNGLVATHPDEPVSLPCFVESLDRPLGVLATQSPISLQPSVGKRSPRIFLFSSAMVLSVVPAGDARNFLEVAQYTSDTRSIKGEIAFPVAAPVSQATPYDRVRDGELTVCAGCHAAEEPVPAISFTQAFESDVLRPRRTQIVTRKYLESETSQCDPSQEPDRCALLTAIYGREVVDQGFSEKAHTIFGD